MINKKYLAFISYSHKDVKHAERLHRALEKFKTPSTLVGTRGRNGFIPKRIFPVFRDRDELPTSHDLGGNLRLALQDSDFLVVVASPNSATSRWVDEEVRYFKQHNSNNNVLVYIAGGVPNSSDQGDASAECFCSSLRFMVNEEGQITGDRCEPIAADARENADGFNRALLKIAAGLLGVSFDDLYNRERRRRRRQLTLTIIVASLAALAFSGLYLRMVDVSEKQSLIVESQAQLGEKVEYLRHGGVLRELGELPPARRAKFHALLAEKRIDERIGELVAKQNEMFGARQKLHQKLESIMADGYKMKPRGFNDGEDSFVKLYGIWYRHVEIELKELLKLNDVGAALIADVYKFENSVSIDFKNFAGNLEEELAVGRVFKSISEKSNSIVQVAINCIHNPFDDAAKIVTKHLKNDDFPFGHESLRNILLNDNKDVESRLTDTTKSATDMLHFVEKADYANTAAVDVDVRKLNAKLLDFKAACEAFEKQMSVLNSFNVNKELPGFYSIFVDNDFIIVISDFLVSGSGKTDKLRNYLANEIERCKSALNNRSSYHEREERFISPYSY